MQAAPAPTIRLHWIPVEPSWLISVGVVLLAVLPHQIPIHIRRALTSWIGAVAFVAVSGWVFVRRPVLGTAMFMLLAAVWLAQSVEGFAAPVLNRNPMPTPHPAQKRRRWFNEEVFHEEPAGIQERTEDPALLYDEVFQEDSDRWFVERTLDEHPEAIMERPVHTAADADDGNDKSWHP
jgi:hypothetical protein